MEIEIDNYKKQVEDLIKQRDIITSNILRLDGIIMYLQNKIKEEEDKDAIPD